MRNLNAMRFVARPQVVGKLLSQRYRLLRFRLESQVDEAGAGDLHRRDVTLEPTASVSSTGRGG